MTTTPAAPSGEDTSGNRLDALTLLRTWVSTQTRLNCGADVGVEECDALLEATRNYLDATPAPESPNVARHGEVDEIVSALYRRFKVWNQRGFGPDDVTWCEVKADVMALIEAARAASQGAAQAPYYKTHEPPHCPMCNCGEAQEAPSADRSAKAVAWQCRPRGFVYWRECTEREFRERSYCGSVPDEWEFRELYTAQPAQPASPGPLQPGASRVTEDKITEICRADSILLHVGELTRQELRVAKAVARYACIAMQEAALSADQGKTGEDQ